MIPVIIGLMTVGALAAVAYPFVRREKVNGGAEAESRLKELLAAKNTIYGTLKELDFDRVAGKLSEADFRQLEAQYRERAIQILREIDEVVGERREMEGPREDLSEALESEIRALRKATRAVGTSSEPAEETLQPVRGELDAPPEPRFCRNCGVPVTSTDNFCSSCGIPLRGDSPADSG